MNFMFYVRPILFELVFMLYLRMLVNNLAPFVIQVTTATAFLNLRGDLIEM